MQWSDEDVRRIEKQFDSFCKTVLKNYARDWHRAKRRSKANEILFSELSDGFLIEPIHIDRHKWLDGYSFYDLEQPVSVENDALARAISALSERKRKIILLFYFYGLTDKQIGDKLHTVRSTVQAARTRALKEMRELLEKRE